MKLAAKRGSDAPPPKRRKPPMEVLLDHVEEETAKRKQKLQSIVDIVWQTFTGSKVAAIIGFSFGGFVPVGIYTICHHELTDVYSFLGLIALGGLVYSATTVYQWAKLLFKNPFKAVGFTLLLEGIMVFSHITWLSVIALCYLVFINGVAGAVEASKKKIEEELC
jgi:hypothetical protein